MHIHVNNIPVYFGALMLSARIVYGDVVPLTILINASLRARQRPTCTYEDRA